jgi:hypothetical protein
MHATNLWRLSVEGYELDLCPLCESKLCATCAGPQNNSGYAQDLRLSSTGASPVPDRGRGVTV